jgi:NTP pyrophosphatase (non-canonical NTP hydrolase)
MEENHIKRFVKLATRTESPAGPVLERIKKNPEAFELFVSDMRKVIKSLQLLDKWKKNLYYGKVIPGLKTKKNIWDKFLEIFRKKEKLVEFDEKMVRILHGSAGTCTEGGELLEAIDKHLTGKQLDITNCLEECADVNWYQNLLYDVFGTNAEESCQLFVDKLKKRFPDKFTEDKAINRDLVTERKLLEDNTKKA